MKWFVGALLLVVRFAFVYRFAVLDGWLVFSVTLVLCKQHLDAAIIVLGLAPSVAGC